MIFQISDPILVRASREFSRHEYHHQIQMIFAFLVFLGGLTTLAGLGSGLSATFCFIGLSRASSSVPETLQIALVLTATSGALIYVGTMLVSFFANLMSAKTRRLCLCTAFLVVLICAAVGIGCALVLAGPVPGVLFLVGLVLLAGWGLYEVVSAPLSRFESSR